MRMTLRIRLEIGSQILITNECQKVSCYDFKDERNRSALHDDGVK